MDIVALEQKYQNLYAPTFEILVEGQNIIEQGVEVIGVNIDNTLDGADTFSFTVFNAFDPISREIRPFVDDLFFFNAEIDIKFGYASEIKTIMFGIITAIKINFPSGGAPQLDVSGFDLSYRMMKEKKPRSWNNKKDSEVVKEIAQEYKLENFPGNEDPFPKGENSIDDTEPEYEQIIKQEKENDFEFLTRLAERNYYEFFVFNKTLYFRKARYKSEPIVTLEWQASLVSFSPDYNIAEQIFKVDVIGQNTEKKQNIEATARLNREERLKIFIHKLLTSGPELIQEQVKQPLESEEQGENLAKSILLKKQEEVFTGSGKSIGVPDILAGTNIDLIGLGSKFSQVYYIIQTNHSLSNSGYKTTFNVKQVPDEEKIEVFSKITPLS